MKKYIPVRESAKATHLCIEFTYIKDPYFGSGRRNPRGYYLRVTPVTRETRYGVQIESFVAFTGTSYCVKEVTRKSAAAEAAAEAAAAQIENTLVSWVLEKNGLELAEEALNA